MHQQKKELKVVTGKTGYSKRRYVLNEDIILTDNNRLLLPVPSFIVLTF